MLYDIVLKLMKREHMHRAKFALLDVVSRHCRLISTISVALNRRIGQGHGTKIFQKTLVCLIS